MERELRETILRGRVDTICSRQELYLELPSSSSGERFITGIEIGKKVSQMKSTTTRLLGICAKPLRANQTKIISLMLRYGY